MKRKINIQTLLQVLAHAKYVPVIIFEIKNWLVFMLNYLTFKNDFSMCFFRDGTKIKVSGNVSASTIGVVFIKKDYGSVPDHSVIIDIGANIGVYSIFAARGEDVTVYAFEPMIDNFNILTENVKLNNFEQKIYPFNLAVGANDEKRVLFLGESPFHSLYPIEDSPFNRLYDKKGKMKQNSAEVECISLKNIFIKNNLDHCDILKLDCEGAEFEIIYNLPKEYFSRIREIRLEYHEHRMNDNYNGRALADFLQKEGFEIKKFKADFPYFGDIWLVNKEYRSKKI